MSRKTIAYLRLCLEYWWKKNLVRKGLIAANVGTLSVWPAKVQRVENPCRTFTPEKTVLWGEGMTRLEGLVGRIWPTGMIEGEDGMHGGDRDWNAWGGQGWLMQQWRNTTPKPVNSLLSLRDIQRKMVAKNGVWRQNFHWKFQSIKNKKNSWDAFSRRTCRDASRRWPDR